MPETVQILPKLHWFEFRDICGYFCPNRSEALRIEVFDFIKEHLRANDLPYGWRTHETFVEGAWVGIPIQHAVEFKLRFSDDIYQR